MKELQRYVTWLRKITRKYSLLQFAYQRGRDDGKQIGIEIGRFQSSLRTTNFCTTHHVATQRNWIDLLDGSRLEVWTCPNWEDHSVFPIHKQETGKILAAYIKAQKDGAGNHTAVMAAIPKRTTQPLKPQKEVH